MKYAALCLMLPFAVSAKCWVGDSYSSPDKLQHVGVSFALGAAAGAVFENKTTAFAAAMLPGLVKEVYDCRSDTHTGSVKDVVANALGAGLGVYTGNFVVKFGRNKTQITYFTTF